MDPNAALERLRRLATQILEAKGHRGHQGEFFTPLEGLACDMADLFEGLDEWISKKKGFLPRDWKGE